MMNQDKEKITKSKARFNILDAIIILVVLLSVIGISFRYSIMQKLGFSEELGNYQVSFKLSAVSYTLPGFLEDGDELYFANGIKAGELLGVSEYSTYTKLTAGNATLLLTTATKYVNNKDGEVVLATYPEYTYIDAKGAFLCQGSYCSKGFFCIGGNEYLAAGQKITLYTDTVTLNMTITGITLMP